MVDLDDEVKPHLKTLSEGGIHPIFRLPPEILCEVFLNYRVESPKKQGFRVLLLTWICCYWRELALGMPTLWSRIDFTHKDWVQHALVHSQEVLLSIDLPLLSNQDPLLSTVIELLPRTQRLSLFFDRRSILHLPTSEDPAPFLEYLELKQFDTPDETFCGVLPSLREVKLSDCTISWAHIPISANLTALSVIDAETGPTSALVSTLRSTPNLETLLLHDVFIAESIFGCEDPVPLPRLQSLSIYREWYRTTTSLLNQLSIPSAARVALRCLQYSNSADDNTILLLAVHKCRYHDNAPSVAKELSILTTGWSYTLEVTET